jgi:hypothetical protein
MQRVSNPTALFTATLACSAMAGLAHAATFQWNVNSGQFGSAGNWAPNATFSGSNSDQYKFGNAGSATVSSDINIDSSMLQTGGGNGAPAGTVTVEADNTLSLGSLGLSVPKNLTSPSALTVNGTVNVQGNYEIAARDAASLTINSGGTFNAGGSGFFGIHNIDGDINSENTAVAHIVNRGTFSSTGDVRFGNGINGGGKGTFVNEGGDASFPSLRLNAGTNPSILEMRGSEGSVSTDFGLYANHSSVRLNFIFDEDGIAPLHIDNEAEINDAVLNINADAAPGGTYTLIDANRSEGGFGVNGSFSAINFTGSRTGTVTIDSATNEVIVETVPEPGALALLVVGGVITFGPGRRSAR